MLRGQMKGSSMVATLHNFEKASSMVAADSRPPAPDEIWEMLCAMKRCDPDQLRELQRQLPKLIGNAVKKKKKEALTAAVKAAAQHGFTLDELVGRSANSTKQPKGMTGKAKFRNPDNQSQTWTGKGRQPNWYKTAIAADKSADDLLI